MNTVIRWIILVPAAMLAFFVAKAIWYFGAPEWLASPHEEPTRLLLVLRFLADSLSSILGCAAVVFIASALAPQNKRAVAVTFALVHPVIWISFFIFEVYSNQIITASQWNPGIIQVVIGSVIGCIGSFESLKDQDN